MKFVHVIVDMLNNQQGPLLPEAWAGLSKSVCDVRETLEQFGVPTIHVVLVHDQSVKPRLGTLGTVDADLQNQHGITIRSGDYGFAIPVRNDDRVLVKNSWSACVNELVSWMKKRGYDGVIVTGVWESEPHRYMNACLNATAIDAASRSFKSIIVSEATNFAHDPQHTAYCFPISQQERKDWFQDRHVDVVPLRDLVAMIAAQSSGRVMVATR